MQVYALLLFAAVFMPAHLLLSKYGSNYTWASTGYRSIVILFIFFPVYLLVHEYVHYATARYLIGIKKEYLGYGILLKRFAAYIRVKIPITINQQRLISITPLIILSIPLLIVTIKTSSPWWLLLFSSHIAGCIGDIMFLFRIQKYDKHDFLYHDWSKSTLLVGKKPQIENFTPPKRNTASILVYTALVIELVALPLLFNSINLNIFSDYTLLIEQHEKDGSTKYIIKTPLDHKIKLELHIQVFKYGKPILDKMASTSISKDDTTASYTLKQNRSDDDKKPDTFYVHSPLFDDELNNYKYYFPHNTIIEETIHEGIVGKDKESPLFEYQISNVIWHEGMSRGERDKAIEQPLLGYVVGTVKVVH